MEEQRKEEMKTRARSAKRRDTLEPMIDPAEADHMAYQHEFEDDTDVIKESIK
jgi:hypothetical protein